MQPKLLALLAALIFVNIACAESISTLDLNDFDTNVTLAKVLNTDAEALQARIDLIQSSRKSITAQYHINSDDESAVAFLALFRQASLRGVKVRLILDTTPNDTSKHVLEYLQTEGVEIREFRSYRKIKNKRLVRHMHDKVLIVDEAQMIAGGRDIDNGSLGRDVYVKGKEPVDHASEYFEHMWADYKHVKPVLSENNSQSTMSKVAMRFDEVLKSFMAQSEFTHESNRNWAAEAEPVSRARFVCDPVGKKGKGPGVEDDIVTLFNLAKKSIVIESSLLSPDAQVLDALGAAVKRGVDVSILTNLMDNKFEKKKTLSLGVKIWEYKGPRAVHAKTFVIDNQITFIGSFNLDRSSYNSSTETGVIIDDLETAKTAADDIFERMKNSLEARL